MDDALISAIRQQYEANLAAYPRKKREVDRFLRRLAPEEQPLLAFLYGSMHPNDVLSFSPAQICTYVQASLRAGDLFPYLQTVPPEIFLSYVLSCRVNAETLDFGRAQLLDLLLPVVQGHTMEETALLVNYWCSAFAAYAPTDNRTLGPLAVLAAGKGRCGEESVLTVSALRAVGIPARQVYVPRWSHCDDNHAWVECWIDGRWHYLGACEPEEVLDRGWFTAAASQAMLVHSRVWSCFTEDAIARTPVYGLVNETGRYADTAVLRVRVLDHGRPVPHWPVEFQVNNYSELFSIHTQSTDVDGSVEFLTGRGDLVLCVTKEDRQLLRKVDLRTEQSVVLDLQDAETPALWQADLVPPAQRPQPPVQAGSIEHAYRLLACEKHRLQQEVRPPREEGVFSAYLARARGNRRQLETFLQNSRWSDEEKLAVLSTLRPKDLADVTAEVLADALNTPRAYGLTEEQWQTYVLAPRVADEPLRPHRVGLRELVFNPAHPRDLLDWMDQQVELLPDYGVRSFYPDVCACLHQWQLPACCYDLAFVMLCRSFGFPARCEPATGQAQWLEDGQWHWIRPQPETVDLTLRSREPLAYGERFTLGRWNGCGYETLDFAGRILDGEGVFPLVPGAYRLCTTTRQIDGTASTRLEHFSLAEPCTREVKVPVDETWEKLQRKKLLPPSLIWQLHLYVEPGAEPTEHLLRELLACRSDFLSCEIYLYIRQGRNNETLQQVLETFPGATLITQWDQETLDRLRRDMGVGDPRLPFSLVQEPDGTCPYACANYQVGTARTFLKVHRNADPPVF